MKKLLTYNFIFLTFLINGYSNSDSLKIEEYHAQFLKYEYINSDSAKYFNDLALKLALKSTCKECVSDSYLYRGYYYDDSGDSDSALHFLNIAMKIAMNLKDTVRIAKVYNNIGYLYFHTGDFDKALKNYILFLNLEENVIGDSTQICSALLNIGNVHLTLKEYETAQPYFEKIESFFLKTNNDLRLGYVYNSLAIVHQYKKERNLVIALEYYNKSLKIKEKINDHSGIPLTLSNIASIYYDQGDYNKSLDSYLESIPLYEKINDANNLCFAYKNTGMVYRKLGDFSNSEIYFLKALDLSKEIENKFYTSEIYSELSILYELFGQSENALASLRQHIIFKDSILGEENIANIRQLEAIYDKDKREKEIQLLNKENEVKKLEISRQNQLKMIFASGFLAMLLIAFFIYRNYLIKKKANIIINEQKTQVEEFNEELNQTNEELATQRDQIELQKHLVEEQRDDIVASIEYAKRIQTAILPPVSVLNKFLPKHFVLYQPKDVVAGDFYWLETKGDDIFIAAADCTGHGVPGAMVSVVCHGALNRCVREYKLTTPSEILDKTRELVLETFQKSEEQVKDGMDISLIKINFKTQNAEWAGANNPLYILRCHPELIEGKTTIEIIKPDKQPIGYVSEYKLFTNHTLSLKDIKQIYLFTDGYADQFGGEKGKKMGYNTFREKLLEISDKDMIVQKDILNNYFSQWKGKEEQVDDVCIIGVKI